MVELHIKLLNGIIMVQYSAAFLILIKVNLWDMGQMAGESIDSSPCQLQTSATHSDLL